MPQSVVNLVNALPHVLPSLVVSQDLDPVSALVLCIGLELLECIKDV